MCQRRGQAAHDYDPEVSDESKCRDPNSGSYSLSACDTATSISPVGGEHFRSREPVITAFGSALSQVFRRS